MKIRNPFETIGPLAGWEMFRLARRGQAYRARMMVLYLLFLAFVLTPPLWFGFDDLERLFLGPDRNISLRERAQFGNRFSITLLVTILLSAVAITPGYAAASLAEEKERESLSLLLTTGLSDREIILGKVAGRVLFVMTAAGAGIPVVLASLLFGGTSPAVLLAGFFLTAASLVLAGSVGILAASKRPDLRSAFIAAYSHLAAYALPMVLFPIFILQAANNAEMRPEAALFMAIPYTAAALALAAFHIHQAVILLRGEEFAESAAGRGPAIKAEGPPSSRLQVADALTKAVEQARDAIAVNTVAAEPEPVLVRERPARPERRAIEPPPIDAEDPLLWKERWALNISAEQGGNAGGFVILQIICGLAFLIGSGMVAYRAIEAEKENPGAHVLLVAGVMAAGLYFVPLAIALAASIARERHRDTLECLLCVPIDRDVILETKLRAAAERGWFLFPVAVLALGTTFASQGSFGLGLLVAGFVLSGWCFVVGLGGYLSIKQPTELKAFRLVLPAVVLVAGAPVSLWNRIDWKKTLDYEIATAGIALFMAVAGAVLWREALRALDRLADPRKG